MRKSIRPAVLTCLSLLCWLSGSPQVPSYECQIGTLTWTTQNLNVDRFRNGDRIPEAKTATEWETADKEHKPAWCLFEHLGNPSGYYGRFYNWYAVNDPRGLAPKGYHVPTKQELLTLIKAVGGQEKGYKLKAKNGWENLQGAPANGTDDFGFNALPSGIRGMELGKMDFVLSVITGCWWCLASSDSGKAPCLRIDYFAAFVYQEDVGVGMPVRLVKDY
jgi:uncharacterized protein (TIGR02145 family)